MYNTIKKPKYRVVQLHPDQGDPSHPIDIVEEVYERIVVARFESDLMAAGENDTLVFRGMMQRKEVQWAYDNAFDEPHFNTQMIVERSVMQYTISMYLKPEHITFWKLKYAN